MTREPNSNVHCLLFSAAAVSSKSACASLKCVHLSLGVDELSLVFAPILFTLWEKAEVDPRASKEDVARQRAEIAKVWQKLFLIPECNS